jgi:hypothetical protein
LRPSQRHIYRDEYEQDESGVTCAYFKDLIH